MNLDIADPVPHMPYIHPRFSLAAFARLELRIDPEQKRLIEEAAEVEHPSVSAFVVDTLVRGARTVVRGREGRTPRPVGGWSFTLPEGWDEPLDAVWELGIKHALGKLPLPVPARDFFAREIATRGYRVLDVQRAHAERAAELPYPDPDHRDPCDRMLVSQAFVEGVPLRTVDGRLGAYEALGLRVVR